MASNIHAMCSSNLYSLVDNKALHNISMQMRARLSCRGQQTFAALYSLTHINSSLLLLNTWHHHVFF